MEGQIMVTRVERNSKRYRKRNKDHIKYLNESFSNYDILEFPTGMVRRTERNRRKIKRLHIEIEKDKEKTLLKISNVIAVSVVGAGIIYCGTGIYFKEHFLPNTKLNGLDVSFKSINEASDELSSKVNNYSLKIYGRDNTFGEITSKDINLQYDLKYDEKIQELKNNQKSVYWISSVFNDNNINNDEVKMVSYDGNLLDSAFNDLDILNSENVTQPKDAFLKFKDGEFVIEDEVLGNKIKKDILYNAIVQAIIKNKEEINLEDIDCYEKPKVTSNSSSLINNKNIINEYKDFSITYEFNDGKYVLEGNELLNLFSFDENYNIVIDKNNVETFVNDLCEKYSTKGKTRKFTTTFGDIIDISGGDYGTIIDKDSEINNIMEALNNKQSIDRQPLYIQTAFRTGKNDISNTYVEINMSAQHLWFYKDGSLICDGDIVSGNTSANRGTPSGIYSLKYKDRNAVLKGVGYSSPVSFWMPFNGGIGMHDASWRSVFGRDFYKTNGSHGCINAPYFLAKSIYENIDSGTPIVCYY